MKVNLGNSGFNNLKSLGLTKYKHVYKYKLIDTGQIIYKARLSLFNWSNMYLDERTAGIQVDIKLIEKGFDPVNILKKKI